MNTIRLDGMTLEPQTAAHADEMFTVLGDAAIYAYENEAPASVEWLRARFLWLESRQSPDGLEGWLNWVVRGSDGALIGYVQATVIHADHSAYVAYVLGSAHWGRGLASRAAAAMLDELAAHHGVRRFDAVLKRANHRSVRLLEGLGFVPATAAALAAGPVDADEMRMTLERP